MTPYCLIDLEQHWFRLFTDLSSVRFSDILRKAIIEETPQSQSTKLAWNDLFKNLFKSPNGQWFQEDINTFYIIHFCSRWLLSIDHNWFNRLRLRQSDRHFKGDIFKCMFCNEYPRIFTQISQNSSLNGPTDHIDSGNGLARQVPSHYLNQWWPSAPMHVFFNQPRCVNMLLLIFFLCSTKVNQKT